MRVGLFVIVLAVAAVFISNVEATPTNEAFAQDNVDSVQPIPSGSSNDDVMACSRCNRCNGYCNTRGGCC